MQDTIAENGSTFGTVCREYATARLGVRQENHLAEPLGKRGVEGLCRFAELLPYSAVAKTLRFPCDCIFKFSTFRCHFLVAKLLTCFRTMFFGQRVRGPHDQVLVRRKDSEETLDLVIAVFGCARVPCAIEACLQPELQHSTLRAPFRKGPLS